MMFAVPVAIMGAIYTAYFMAPVMRRIVKPGIEIMAALPTVILGFLAGLWLAPMIEANLTAVLSILLVMPAGTLLAAWLWSRLPDRPDPAVPGLVRPAGAAGDHRHRRVAFSIGPWLEVLLFGGNTRTWLLDNLGLGYDQRNALVVGLAMGLAVIPTIFSIAEDAIYGVPTHLINGSLALGATPWQTLMRVVMLTASPGIFSAVMIGLGRAVGETMIVLMATGNTPVMDLNIFEGMRTFAANIAVELPESEVTAPTTASCSWPRWCCSCSPSSSTPQPSWCASGCAPATGISDHAARQHKPACAPGSAPASRGSGSTPRRSASASPPSPACCC
jgi:phosphate transport system permease protein